MMKHIVSRILMLTVMMFSVNILFAQERPVGEDKGVTEEVKQDSKDSKGSKDPKQLSTKKTRSSSDQVSSDSEGKKDKPKSFFGRLFGKTSKSSSSAEKSAAGKSALGKSSAKKGGNPEGKGKKAAPSVGDSKDEHKSDEIKAKDGGGR